MKCVKLRPGMYVTVHEPFCLDLRFAGTTAEYDAVFVDSQDANFIVPRNYDVTLTRGPLIGSMWIREIKKSSVKVALRFPMEVLISYGHESGQPFRPRAIADPQLSGVRSEG